MDKLKDFFANLSKEINESYKESSKYKRVSPSIYVNEIDKIIQIKGKKYSYNDIIDCELIEDGNSIVKSSLIGTAAKGMTFGLAGYLTSAKKEKKFCNKLQVKITVNNLKQPCIYFDYINKKTKTESKDYESAFNKAQKCLSTIKVIIDRK